MCRGTSSRLFPVCHRKLGRINTTNAVSLEELRDVDMVALGWKEEEFDPAAPELGRYKCQLCTGVNIGNL